MLSENHRADMQGSGLQELTIRDSDVYTVAREEAAQILGFDPGGPGLAFPYAGTANGNGGPFIRIKPNQPFTDSEGAPTRGAPTHKNNNHKPGGYEKND